MASLDGWRFVLVLWAWGLWLIAARMTLEVIKGWRGW